jgi:hypothetical protein
MELIILLEYVIIEQPSQCNLTERTMFLMTDKKEKICLKLTVHKYWHIPDERTYSGHNWVLVLLNCLKEKNVVSVVACVAYQKRLYLVKVTAVLGTLNHFLINYLDTM